MNKKNVVICVSWPYANNNLHLGYVASSLSGDILARYHRMHGDNVLMVSGSDSHGTKIELKAKQQGCTPEEIVNKYHENFVEALKKFNFSFDMFGTTYDPYHIEHCQEIFKKLYKNGYLYEKTILRPFCDKCNKFISDTEIEITCPECGRKTKGDNCDCGHVPNDQDLSHGTCLICGTETHLKENKVLVFKLSAFKNFLTSYLELNRPYWRANSINETEKYLKDLQDRDFSRDLDWGVKIPIEGFESKSVWVWYEALLGYLTESMQICEAKGLDWQDFWKTDHCPQTEKLIYMCHAKDNIPFHSLFFPAMLEGLNENFVAPNRMVSAEYLLMNNEKISKSKSGNTFEALSWANEYNTDTLRYFFTVNGPEKKDCNFTLDLYKATHNEVVNKFGNLVNRTLKYKGLTEIPVGKVDEEIKKAISDCYTSVSREIENIEFKKAGNLVMDLIELGNKYFDDRKPWVQIKEDMNGFNDTIYTCAYLIANLSNLVEPFMPNSANAIRTYLGISNELKWEEITSFNTKIDIEKIQPLFIRI